MCLLAVRRIKKIKYPKHLPRPSKTRHLEIQPGDEKKHSSAAILAERESESTIKSNIPRKLEVSSAYMYRVRCDRLKPCHNCSSRGLGQFCVYSTRAPAERAHGRAHLQDRINHLENTIVCLIKGIEPSRNTSIPTPQTATPAQETSMQEQVDQGEMQISLPSPYETPPENDTSHRFPKHDICTTENGSIKIRDSEVTYASNAHWAAVLDSIAELRNELGDESNAASVAGGGIQPPDPPCPRLFYGGDAPAMDLDSVLECLPPRIVVDRSVSRYFNSLDATAGKSEQVPLHYCRYITRADWVQAYFIAASSFERYVLPPLCFFRNYV